MGHRSRLVNKLPCLVLLCLSLSGFAQTYYTTIKTFNEAEGFNATETSYITQDKKGFIWIASRNGLFRFNGTTFKHYTHNAGDSFSLAANQVNFCYQDKDGDYWVGIFGKGLYRFNDSTEQFIKWKNKNTQEINVTQLYNVIAPFEDSHGRLWMSAATIGIIRINKKEGTAKLFNVCDQQNPVDLFRSCRWVHHFSEDNDGWFWLSSNDGMIHFNPSNGAFKVFHENAKNVTCYFKDSQGKQWIGTWGEGLKEMDTSLHKWKRYLWTQKTPGTTNILTGIEEKDKDHLWVSSMDAGPMLFNKRTGSFTLIANQNKNQTDLKIANSVLKDREGNLWIVGQQQLGRISTHNPFQYVSICTAASKSSKTASCFLHLRGDSLVFIGATYDKQGLHAYNLFTKKLRVIQLHIPKSSEDVKDIFCDSKKQIWIATNYGVYLVDKKSLLSKRFESPSKKYTRYFENSFVKILEDKNHGLWFVSRWQGMFHLNVQTKTIVHYSADSTGRYHIPMNQIEYATLDDHQNIWVGTHAYLEGQPPLFCITSNGQLIDYGKQVPLNTVFQLASTKQNTILAATASIGLFEITSALHPNENIRLFSEDNGIADSYIEGLAVDKKGNIWITTHNGLSCKTSEGNFVNFYTEDGLCNNKIEGRPYIDEDGNLFLPFENGFQFLNLDSLLSHRSSIGSVILESLNINQKKVPGNPNYLRQLSLDYNENNLSLEFSAFDLSQGSNLQYTYQLEGSDTKWNNIGLSKRLFFSNLSPGDYKLKLRASDRFGNLSKQEFILPIIIHPPFWKTWWFYSLCLIAIVTLSYLFYRVKVNSIIAEQKLRNKIARDLHDDIGSTLSGIKLFSNIAQTKLKEQKSEAANIVERIGERSEKMIDAMSDIVWSINPVNDSIENMLVRMKQYAAEMLEIKEINYEFIVDEKVMKTKFGLETRKDIYLIFKEAVNNAVKYAECKNLKINLKLNKKNFEMAIADDGKGFDVFKNKNVGNGLNNFKQRANHIGGKITIDSIIDKGTVITLQLPLT